MNFLVSTMAVLTIIFYLYFFLYISFEVFQTLITKVSFSFESSQENLNFL